jgi:hypothetical protein
VSTYGDYPRPESRVDRDAVEALSAAMWSSQDADRLFRVVRPVDFPPGYDTIAAAILDLRRRLVDWSGPSPVIENLCRYRDLWRDRVDSGKFGLPVIETPIEELLDPDRWPLRFAGRELQTFRAYDVMMHVPTVDVETAASRVAADRRHEVAESTMRAVHGILIDAPAGTTRAERQEAVGKLIRGYRQTMTAQHLYPRGPQHGTEPERIPPGIAR